MTSNANSNTGGDVSSGAPEAQPQAPTRSLVLAATEGVTVTGCEGAEAWPLPSTTLTVTW